MVGHMRFHGRGGEGVRLASRIVSRAAFLAGFSVQDSPLYGAERRGAPVAAFIRFGEDPISERGYIERPDVLVLLDESLLDDPDAAVLDGVDDRALVLANSEHRGDELQRRRGIAARTVTLDVTSIVLAALGSGPLSAAMAAFAVRATKLAPWSALDRAVRRELADAGVDAPRIERNVAAAQRVFDLAPPIGLPTPPALPAAPPPAPFVVPRVPARIAAPVISAGATSALRSTAGWRIYRPVIDLAHCTRCFLCFALCPEGAIHLDAEHYPHVDYQHCKGCLVCVAECPPHVIAQEREHAG
jgi:pyruvate ferredoxin oxidoreductase gamma subunit